MAAAGFGEVVTIGFRECLSAVHADELPACVHSKTGILRIADQCKKKETKVTLNTQGVPGIQGPPGAQGPAGTQGPPGVISVYADTGTGAVGNFLGYLVDSSVTATVNVPAPNVSSPIIQTPRIWLPDYKAMATLITTNRTSEADIAEVMPLYREGTENNCLGTPYYQALAFQNVVAPEFGGVTYYLYEAGTPSVEQIQSQGIPGNCTAVIPTPTSMFVAPYRNRISVNLSFLVNQKIKLPLHYL